MSRAVLYAAAPYRAVAALAGGAAALVAAFTGWVPIAVGGLGAAVLVALASSTPLAAAAAAALAPFDGYIPSLVLYRDFLAADILGLLVVSAVAAGRGSGRAASGWRIVLAAWLLLCTLEFVSAATVGSVAAAAKVARLVYLTVFWACLPLAVPERAVRTVVMGLVAGTLARFVYEANSFFRSPDFQLHPSFQFGVFTSNPNTLAGFGACVLPLAIALVPGARTRTAQALYATAVGILAAGIVISFSKGAWVAAGAAIAVWLAHRVRESRVRVKSLALAGLLGLLVVAVTPLQRIPRLIVARWISHGSELSNAERLRYAVTAVRIMRDHPIRGVGLGRFGAAYREDRGTPLAPDDAHNAYLWIGAEVGIPAMATFLFIVGAVVIAAQVAAVRAGRAQAPIRLGLAASVAGLAVFGLFNSEPLTARTAWVLYGLAFVARAPDVAPGP